MLSTQDAILARRSVRGFLPQPVAEPLMRSIFELAQRAPSNCNTQPWVVHVASGATVEVLRKRIMAAAPERGQQVPDFAYSGRYEGVYRERQLDAAVKLYGAMGVTREDKAGRDAGFMRNYEFFGAPHVAFVYIPDGFGVREAADCGMYAQTLMLALSAHGLASCPQTALSFFPNILREVLGVDPAHKLLFGISFGHEDKTLPANTCRVGREVLGREIKFHG